MKTYIKLFALIGTVTLSAALLSACDDHPAPPAPQPAAAPEPVKPNS